MFRQFSVILLLSSSSLAFAKQTSTNAPEPEYRDQYTVLAGGHLVPLERETAMTDTQSRRNFVITPNTKVFESIPHPASPLRVPPGIHFFVKASVGDRNPATIIHLHPLEVSKKDRRIPIVTYKKSLVPFGGMKHDRAEDDSIAFSVKKYGASSLEIIPSSPLPPGEYAFVSGHNAQCFGVDAGLTEPIGGGSPSEAAAATPPPPAPKPEWRLKPTERTANNDDVHTAMLPGTVEVGGKRGAALLSISCKLQHYTAKEQPTAIVPVELQIRREMVQFKTDTFSCEGDGATGSRSVYTEVGAATIPARNACFDGVLSSDPKQLMTFQLIYEDAVVKSIADASSGLLAVKLHQQPSGAGDLTARFALPENAPTLQSMLAPCMEMRAAQHKKEEESIAASCPVIVGESLSQVAVLAGPGMKKLAPDPDNSIGITWNLPKTKVRPKLTLACSYEGAGESKGAAGAAEKKMVPIPATGKYCEYRADEYTNVSYGRCTR